MLIWLSRLLSSEHSNNSIISEAPYEWVRRKLHASFFIVHHRDSIDPINLSFNFPYIITIRFLFLFTLCFHNPLNVRSVLYGKP